jgi:hypothetical protein
MNPGAVLYDPTAPVAVVVAPAKPVKARVIVEEALVVTPAPVEVASSEVGVKLGTNINPMTEVTGTHKETMTMLNVKNLSVSVNGNTVSMTIVDPALRGEITASGKSKKVAWAGGIVEIGGGLRMNVSITKDGLKG